MHLHGGAVDAFGGEAVGDGSHLHVLVEQHAEDGEMVLALLGGHDLLDCTEADVVLVVDAVAFQPAVEVI